MKLTRASDSKSACTVYSTALCFRPEVLWWPGRAMDPKQQRLLLLVRSEAGLGGGSQELMERSLRAWVGGTGVSAGGRQNRSRGATETQREDAGASVSARGD